MLTDEHLPYLYIGYKAGMFETVKEDFPEGLERDDFDQLMGQYFGNAIAHNNTLITLKANAALKRGGDVNMVPIGLVYLSIFQSVAHPHVFWMPWARPRNKMEASVKFLADLKKEHPVMVVVGDETLNWFKHLSKYGVLRRVGNLKNFFGKEKDAALFEGVKEWVA